MWIAIGIILLIFFSTIILNKRISSRFLDIFSVSFAWISWIGVTALFFMAIFVWPLPMTKIGDDPEFNLCRNIAYDSAYIYTVCWEPYYCFQVRRITDGSIVDSVKLGERDYPVQLCGFATNGKIKVFSFEGDYFEESYRMVAVCGGKIIYARQPFPGKENQGSVYYSRKENAFIATSLDRHLHGDTVFLRKVPADSTAIAKGPGYFADIFREEDAFYYNSDRDYLFLPETYYECDDRLFGLSNSQISSITFDADDSMRIDTLHFGNGIYDINGSVIYNDYKSHDLYSFSCGKMEQILFPAPWREAKEQYSFELEERPITYFSKDGKWKYQGAFYQDNYDRTDSLPDHLVFLPSGVLCVFEHTAGSATYPGWYSACKLMDESGKEKLSFTMHEGYDDVYLEHRDTLTVYDLSYGKTATFSLKDGHRIDFPGLTAIFDWRFNSNQGSHFFFIWLSLFLWPFLLIWKVISDRKSGEKNSLRVYAWLYALMASVVLATMISNVWF